MTTEVATLIDPAAFGYLVDLVRRRSAMSIDARQDYWVSARLAPLAREAGEPSVDAFLALIQRTPEGALHDRVVQSIAVNETSWFRDPEVFGELATEVLPAAWDQLRTARPLRIWSAGCASGQEPYTIAMVAEEFIATRPNASVSIVATDFSAAMLERARQARYSTLEVNRGLPARTLIRAMTREGTDWVVQRRLRDMVTVLENNLATDPPPLPLLDVVFLRNVLIYFDVEAKRRVLDNISKVLAPGGFVVLGTAESTIHVDSRFVRGRGGLASWYQLELQEDHA